MLLSSPFLTDIDPQAAVKGSRDPLGVQPIWSRLGRHVIGNVTTVSTSVRDFTTTILGYYFAERAANEADIDGDLGVFLRWEQLAAYARASVNKDMVFRGTERVVKNLHGGGRIYLGTDSAAQILGNQKTYGLWGLYTGPSRASGLVEGDPTRVTPAARELIEKVYLPIFARSGFRNGDPVARRLAKPKSDLEVDKVDRPLLQAVAKVLDKKLSSEERVFYREHLLLGGPYDRTEGRQAILASAYESTFADDEWWLSPDRVRALAKASRANLSGGEVVAEFLERIRTSELLLAPAVALFSVILESEGQTVAELASAVRKEWGSSMPGIDPEATARLESDFQESTGDVQSAQRWIDLSKALVGGEYATVIELLMEQNQFVMKARGGAAPWVYLDKGLFKVRFKDDATGRLPARTELPHYWRHSYFVDSLRTVALAVRGNHG